MIDFLIVGNGLAGHVMAHTLKNNQLSFNIVGDSALSQSSRVAAGIWNPIVFKRMTKSWLADELIDFLIPFYSDIEKKIEKKIITLRPILKSFFEEQEKQLWLKKCTFELEKYLDPAISKAAPDSFKNHKLTSEFGVVKSAGNIDLEAFIDESQFFFGSNYINTHFFYKDLLVENNYVKYKGISYKNAIFCEGYLVKNNPYFNWVPLKPAKGETISISANGLEIENVIINKNGFIFNKKSDIFKVGATYNWKDLTDDITDDGKNELQQKLNHLISCNYQILAHQAGVRPSSIDRRPIIGLHPKYKNLQIFNGLGTKGVMLAPYFANNFVHFYQQKQPLIKEVNVDRFYPLYKNAN
ncbi:MAG: FAD-dependent oxidoreductase [Bacteroidota bacterium]|nr:FAD-dependent oxidoreductase [Bacteroidota bacterium]